MKIAVVGLGYVGVANALLLAKHNEVVALDIDIRKVQLLNKKNSPIDEPEIDNYLKTEKLNIRATTDKVDAYKNADYILIAVPTDYDENTNGFNLDVLELILMEAIKQTPRATIIIKSTIPVGYTQKIRNKLNTENIIFCPEFLREGLSLYDSLHPSRIILSEKTKEAFVFAKILQEAVLKNDTPILFIDSTEAEAVKLFSNAYLAMRVAFFNELDTYSQDNDLSTQQIIDGVVCDPRIGNFYNNPSFGYGGYCLPKDTRQLLANYNKTPQTLISAIISSNTLRRDYLANHIINKNPNSIGIYRMAMKTNSENFRESSILKLAKILKSKGGDVIIYEPSIKEDEFEEFYVEKDFSLFKKNSDIIVANRMAKELMDVKSKVFTRDIYSRD